MNRDSGLKKLREIQEWDFIIIGGGATGLGVAVDAASRGFKTLLLEQSDFAKGTSSRSTKLVHGGVRYLEQGNMKLVREALKERGYFLRNAPHIAKKQAFIIPVFSVIEKLKYRIGMKLYDQMSGKFQMGHSLWLSKKNVLKKIPAIKNENLKGGVLYFDGQFDDSRMAINLAATCSDQGGTTLNYIKVTGLIKNENGKISGVNAIDLENNNTFSIKGRVVVNATGVFVDTIHKMDTGKDEKTVQPSQGIHLVLPLRFLKTNEHALMIPKTEDGRVLFFIPWHEHLLVGTTDTPLDVHTLEPRAIDKEIKFILDTASQYLKSAPTGKDVLGVYAGLRPLAIPGNNGNKKKSTKDISRHHVLNVSRSGLVTITGGKWTTYRRMAEVTVDKAIEKSGLPYRPCVTKYLRIHGFSEKGNDLHHFFGKDAEKIQQLIIQNPELGEKIDMDWLINRAEVVWTIREEMARNIEDVLSRRFRVLLLDAKAAMRMAPQVASILKKELGKDDEWEQNQIKEFMALASGYLIRD